jgi:hypothetical protein
MRETAKALARVRGFIWAIARQEPSTFVLFSPQA